MPALLECDDLAKRFGETQAVDGLSFQVNSGEIYGLLGPNGAGKTTAISMICGLLKPDRGSVQVDGHPMATESRACKKVLGVTPQEIAVYEELSGWENLIAWGRIAGLKGPELRQRCEEILETLSLSDRAEDRVKAYSGGMKRRLNIGLSLLHRPKLLLLDEPTVGIDPQARANILTFVQRLAKSGVAVLYTTHYLDEAENLCDRIAIVDHGKLLAEGSLESLRNRLGEEHIFQLEGSFEGVDPTCWPGFTEQFRVMRQSEKALTVAGGKDEDPAETLRSLLTFPTGATNVTYRQPSLNEVFLQLTGKDLRE